MYKEIRLNTIEEVLAMTADQPYNERWGRHRDHCVYRGLPDASFHLKTSLQRNCGARASKLEVRLLQNLGKYAALEPGMNTDTEWKTMLLGQHHGLPTRLLDWTRSPLVALNFATDQYLGTLDQTDAAVWRIDIEEIHTHLPEPFRKEMRERHTQTFSLEMLQNAAPDTRTYDELTRGESMVIMEPPSVDPRIVSQYAHFAVVPSQMTDIEDFLAKYTEKTVKFIISKDLKWQLRDYLDEANMNERMIYPGLDGICKWLARKYYVKDK